MKKIGQLTIFIILGLIILTGIVIYFLYKPSTQSSIPKEVQPIEDFIENCLIETGKISTREVAFNGGYFVLTDEQKIADNSVYYFYKNQTLIPPIEKVEQSISASIYENLFYCTKNFNDFLEYNISEDLKDVSVKIENSQVKINADYEIIIQNEDSSYKLEKFEVSFNSGIKKLYDSSLEIVNLYSETPGEICFSCFYELMEGRTVDLETIEYQELIIFNLKEKKQLNEEEYVFALEW